MNDTNGTRPHEVRWDEAAGRRVRTLRAGRDDPAAAPVVLVPGLGAVGYLVDTLHGCAARTGAALLDVPGFGHRGPGPAEPEVDDITRVVTDWLRAAADRPVVLFGHSTGAQVAVRVAVAVPDRVAALVLGGPTFPPHLRTLPPLAPALARDLRHESPGLARTLLPYYLRGGTRAMLRFVSSAQRDRPEETIRSVSCPVTVVRGEHDPFSPEPWAQELADSAPHGRLVTVPGAHTFPYGRGGLTAALVTGCSPSCSPAPSSPVPGSRVPGEQLVQPGQGEDLPQRW